MVVTPLNARTVRSLRASRDDIGGFARSFTERVAAYNRAETKPELSPIRLHDLRHTWATLALGDGVHPKIVSERLGHSKIAITLDIYSHALPTIQREAAERVASLIFGVTP